MQVKDWRPAARGRPRRPALPALPGLSRGRLQEQESLVEALYIDTPQRSVMRLLLALDSSAQSELVVSEVIGRPWHEGTEVCVLTVVDLLALFGGAIAGLLEPFSENENKAAKSLVQSVRTR